MKFYLISLSQYYYLVMCKISARFDGFNTGSVVECQLFFIELIADAKAFSF